MFWEVPIRQRSGLRCWCPHYLYLSLLSRSPRRTYALDAQGKPIHLIHFDGANSLILLTTPPLPSGSWKPGGWEFRFGRTGPHRRYKVWSRTPEVKAAVTPHLSRGFGKLCAAQ